MYLKPAHTKEKVLIKQELKAAANVVIIPLQSSSLRTDASEARRILDRMGYKAGKLGQCKVNCLLWDPATKERKQQQREKPCYFAEIFYLQNFSMGLEQLLV